MYEAAGFGCLVIAITLLSLLFYKRILGWQQHRVTVEKNGRRVVLEITHRGDSNPEAFITALENNGWRRV